MPPSTKKITSINKVNKKYQNYLFSTYQLAYFFINRNYSIELLDIIILIGYNKLEQYKYLLYNTKFNEFSYMALYNYKISNRLYYYLTIKLVKLHYLTYTLYLFTLLRIMLTNLIEYAIFVRKLFFFRKIALLSSNELKIT